MRFPCLLSPLRTLVFFAVLYLFAPASAQAQSPYLYASIPNGTTSLIAGYSVDRSGKLTPVPGSPLSLSREGGLVATDPADQFLFVLNATTNAISVLSIDSSSGALTEVLGSPVPAPVPPPGGGSPPSNPICMATFRSTTNNFLYVAYRNGPSAFTGAIVVFQIGTPGQPLIPTSTTTLEATPVDITVSPKGNLYAALQLVPGSNLGNQSPGVALFPIDPNSGELGQPIFVNSNLHEDSLALNPRATVLFDGEGSPAAGLVESAQIRSDGTTLPPQSLPVVSPNSPPSSMLVDGSGQLLYVQQGGQAAVYTINQTTGVLSAPSTSPAPLPFNLGRGATLAHPVEPYLYTLQSGGEIHVFEITDETSGALRELTDSPYNVPGAEGAGGLTLTHDAASQTPAATSAQLVPAAINFAGDTPVGQSVADNSALLTNTGTEALSIKVTITGADQSDFSTTNCPSPLAPRTSCPITVTFTPTQAGAREATLIVADSAGPQTLQLTGNGVGSGTSGAGGGSGSGGNGGSGSGGSGSGGSGSGGSGNPPSSSQPVVSINPTSLIFVSSALNTATPQQQITLTNSSTSANSSPLSISSIEISGQNASDFALVNSCPASSTYAPNQSCSLSVVFTPSQTGTRTAELSITDNAANSPQSIVLAGSVEAQVLTITPADSNAFAQTISAGQTATYNLQLAATFNGTVSFSPCSGAPAAATCSSHTPIPVIGNQPPVFFSVTVATVASSSPIFSPQRVNPYVAAPGDLNKIFFSVAFAFALFFVILRIYATLRSPSPRTQHRKTSTFNIAASSLVGAAALLALSLFASAGCGGASTIATAPVATTPGSQSQSYTITITPTATTSDNLPVPNVQPLRLTLVVN